MIQYIPEFRLFNEELSSRVTLRDLVAHRTGIPRHDALWHLICDMSEEDVLAALPSFPPASALRESFQYNNFMYVVAGHLIKKVTQNRWEDEVFSRILHPLEMNHSGTSLKGFQLSPNHSKPYAEIGGNIQTLPLKDPCSTLAASALYSSASDMAKWIQVQLQEKPLSGFAQEMHEIHMPYSSSEKAGYGLGWEIDTYRGRKRVHHLGIVEGFFSTVTLLPNEKIGLAIMTNSSTDGRYAISYIEKRIYDSLLGIQAEDCLQEVREERLQAKHPYDFPALHKYEGLYTHPGYGTMQISTEYDSLVATLGNMRVELKEKSEGIFEAKFPSLLSYGIDPIVQFSFFSNSSGAVNELHVPFEHFRSAPPVIFKK